MTRDIHLARRLRGEPSLSLLCGKQQLLSARIQPCNNSTHSVHSQMIRGYFKNGSGESDERFPFPVLRRQIISDLSVGGSSLRS